MATVSKTPQRRILRITVELLSELLRGTSAHVWTVGLPADARIIDCRFDKYSEQVELLIESVEFLPGEAASPGNLFAPIMLQAAKLVSPLPALSGEN